MGGLIMPRRVAERRFLEGAVTGIGCDHTPHLLELDRCKTPGEMAPRLCVPSKTQNEPGHTHLHVDFMEHHYCHKHTGEITVDWLFAQHPRLKASVEQAAKHQRPIDFRCDFEAAHIVYVSVFTPEYKYFAAVRHLVPRAQLQESWGATVL